MAQNIDEQTEKGKNPFLVHFRFNLCDFTAFLHAHVMTYRMITKKDAHLSIHQIKLVFFFSNSKSLWIL